MHAVGPGTVLDGLFIEGGAADGLGLASRSNGAGIFATDSAPTLRNLVVTNCDTTGAGGAIYLGGSSTNFATVTDSWFGDNACDQTGGAIIAFVPSVIQGCEFVANAAPSGGAVRLLGPVVHTIDRCEFRSNEATAGSGPAVYVAMPAGSFAFITNCDFRNNDGTFGGALEFAGEGDYAVRSCRFLANEATISGAGAIDFDPFFPIARLVVENSLFTGNRCAAGVGAIYNRGAGELDLVNCTIAFNTSDGLAGGLLVSDGQTRVNNSIIWGNDSASQSGQYDSIRQTGSASLVVNHTVIQGLGISAPPPAGVNTTGDDPLLADIDGPDDTPGTVDDNARLSPGSPAIDAGVNLYLDPSTSADIHAQPRYADDPGTPDTGTGDGANPVVDIGAAEFQGVTPGPCNGADLAEPYGTLDFSDVIAFLAALDAMDPDADLAPPLGVFDFSDIVAFLGAYDAGCP